MEKITIEDVMEYDYLFTLVPPFILERMAKKNSNLVGKFKSKVQSYIDNLSTEQRIKLIVVLNSDVSKLQEVMMDSYFKTNKKQYKILANPDYKSFIVLNLDELRKMI
ncbi:hypothetical protein [Methanobrevibacter sp.]|uniref:hypothetical protein n=1 Tax=Methanobrevibacter sp. TaxID=66852 RepID=UPI003D7D1188